MIKTYKILSLKKRQSFDSMNNILAYVKYKVTAQEDQILITYQGECKLPLPLQDSLINYNDLTEDLVISWVRSVIDEDKLDDLLSKLIFNEKYKAIEGEIPWEL